MQNQDLQIPTGFNELVEEIHQSHKESGNNEYQEKVLKKCLTYLFQNYQGRHWFCDPHMCPITIHSLILFSFPSNDILVKLQLLISENLKTCEKCLKCFNIGKSELRKNFALSRRIPMNQVKQFLLVIDKWDIERNGEVISSIIKRIDDNESTENIFQTEIERQVFRSCLWNPSSIRSDKTLQSQFGEICKYLYHNNSDIHIEELYPGLLYMLIEGTEDEQNYAVKLFEELKAKGYTINNETYNLTITDEFSRHLFNIQNATYFSSENCIKFWNMFNTLLSISENKTFLDLINKPYDIEIMSEYTDIRLYPSIRVFFNNIMAFLDEPLPVLFNTLDILISKFSTDFWSYSTPFSFISILDTILPNPHFGKRISLGKESETPDDFLKLIDWMPKLVNSLSGSQKQTASIRLSTFLFQQSPNSISKNTFTNNMEKMACKLLSQCLDFEGHNNRFRESKFSVNLLSRRDSRAAVETHADKIVNLPVNGTTSLTLIENSISYDVTLLAHNTKQLIDEKVPASFDTFPVLWRAILNLPTKSLKALIPCILSGLPNICNVLKFLEKKQAKEKQLSDAINVHNSNVSMILSLVSNILEKIGLMDQNYLTELFHKYDIQIGFWSCIFSPITNQAALDILYQVFDLDVAGRFETIQSLLNAYFNPTLSAINKIIKKLTITESFEPCPKAIRILMDIVKSLTDPLTGILTSSLTSEESKMLMVEFWNNCWAFLVMLYRKTLTWAGEYQMNDLVEYTRDTLEFSHILLDSFRLITTAIESNDRGHSLFLVFMNSFSYVIVWLRLGDTSLLNSCVDLVFKGFDLANDLEFSIDDEFILNFAKFGAKAKKFNNKLSELQRLEILSKAREFNNDLVEEIILETNLQRSKAKQQQQQQQSIESSSLPTPEAATFKYQTHIKQPRQQTLGRFGVVTLQAPVAPPPKKTEFKSSVMEQVRNELKSSRVSLKPSTPLVAPAAPRAPGFNSKKPVSIGRSLNTLKKKKVDSDSSDEDDNDNVDISDLFVDKKKSKAKIIEIDVNGKPIVKSAMAKAKKTRTEEEEMRLRLNVNLKPLYSTILKWNYNSNDEFPSASRDIYQATMDQYSDIKEYIKVMEPLLMLECWQGIQSAKQTGDEKPFELLIGSRSSVDGFFDVYASIKKQTVNDLRIGDSDLLVLGCIEPLNYSSPKAIAQHLKAPTTNTCMAKVREIKSANAEFFDITLRVFPQGSMMGVLTPKSIIHGMRIMQMITVEREYSSLKGLQYYGLCDAILLAKPNTPPEINDADEKTLLKAYNVNSSQARAILGSYSSEGFSLIQGPPGTGKTKTILGIVGYWLSKQQREGSIKVPNSITNTTGTSSNADIPKILICAPSNAAVDELVIRLRGGVKNSKGETISPQVVRLGRSDAINSAVKDLTLEELVDKQLQYNANETQVDHSIREQHTKCIAERDQLRSQLQNSDLNDAETTILENKLRENTKKRKELAQKLDEQRERVSIAYRTREIDRRNMQSKILTNAQIICATLSGSAHSFLANLTLKFDQVIIDEACQCVELSALIPLRYGCKRCIMVGDPNQLPPTVLSQKASSFNYEESLFVRMQKANPKAVYLLDTQYRMHPDISEFPSAEFYNSNLHDGAGMSEKNYRIWHDTFPLSPYRFFDIVGSHQQNELSRSLFNMSEAKVAMEMVAKLMQILPEDKFGGRIGIISPYKEQIRVLKDIFRRKYGHGILSEIDFNTVDGFQGQEKEIIIMSCVRASETGNVGFLSDIRRMNVALTRARTSLWILGNKSSLSRNKVWKRLLENAEERKCISEAYPGFLNKISRNSILNNKRSIENGEENTVKKKKKVESSENTDISSKTGEKREKKSESSMADNNKANIEHSGSSKPIQSDSSKPIRSDSSKPIHSASSKPINSGPKPINSSNQPYSESKNGIAKPSKSGYIPNNNSKHLLKSSIFNQNSVASKNNPDKPKPKAPVPTSSGRINPLPKKKAPSIFLNSKRPRPKH